MVMVGNFEVDVEHQQRIGHLLGPLPPEMRDDTAFMDRIHSYIPGWDVPKVSREQLTEHFGLVSDFLSSCWNHLRSQSRVNKLQGRILFGGALSGRDDRHAQNDERVAQADVPDPQADIPDDAIAWAASSRWNAAEGSRSSKAHQGCRIPQHPFQLHHVPRWDRAICLDT
jgi:ATP-dependent Lon protease